jgi:hypothetical protein
MLIISNVHNVQQDQAQQCFLQTDKPLNMNVYLDTGSS